MAVVDLERIPFVIAFYTYKSKKKRIVRTKLTIHMFPLKWVRRSYKQSRVIPKLVY